MTNLPKVFVDNLETNILLTAAEIAGWQVAVTHGKEANLVTISKNGQTYRAIRSFLSVNDAVGIAIAANKYITHLVLSRATPFVTHPEKLQISELTDEHIQKLLQKYSKLVVKPLDENNGIGVTTSLTSVETVKKAVGKISQLGHLTVLIENHIDIVNEYRVILWKGRAIDIFRRIPAFVVGDGHSNVKELIDQKNHYRFTELHNLFEPIKLDDDCVELLKKSALTPESVIPKGMNLTLETTCNLSQGGETERVDLASIHQGYLDLFMTIYHETGLNYVGADLISPDLVNPPQLDKTAINELNSAPGPTIGVFADMAINKPFWGYRKLLAAIEADPPK